jgi:hypothetical protein
MEATCGKELVGNATLLFKSIMYLIVCCRKIVKTVIALPGVQFATTTYFYLLLYTHFKLLNIFCKTGAFLFAKDTPLNIL